MDQHKQWLNDFYQKLADDLRSGNITPQQLAQKLTENHLQLEQKADYDGLISTFLNNNGFNKALDKMIQVVQRLGNLQATLLALDIDHLKKFNDTMGHPAGDKLIRLYAKVIENMTRAVDLKGRLGGDEFAVFLLGANKENAQLIAERIRTSIIETVKQTFPDLPWEQTISIGITPLLPADTVDSLRRRADETLYEAKKGRNQVVVR